MNEEKKVTKKPRTVAAVLPPPVVVNEVLAEDEDELQQECSPWKMRIAGLKIEIPVSAMKLPTFTTGMLHKGETTIELINSPQLSLNAYFRAWMAAPAPRAIELDVLDADGEKIELWKMSAVPAAMGFSEFSTMAEDPWSTQVMFSVSDIKIESKFKH
jgi:hypothetical protein